MKSHQQIQLKKILLVLIPILGMTCVSISQAQSAFPSFNEWTRVNLQGKTSVTLNVENDSLLLKKDDGFFTSGNQIIVKKSLQDQQGISTYAWHLGQDLYTASDINLKPNQINKNDHPYAGWLYAGVYKERQEQNGSESLIGFTIGCLGPCAGGEWTQTNLHKFLNQPLPQAWSTQLKQEWGVVAQANLSPARWQINSSMDLSPRFKTRLGNIFTDASAELTWRVGQLSSLAETNTNHLFARTEVKLVGYNATIQGGYFNNQQLLTRPKRLVPEIELGYQYRHQTWGISASIIRRGSEIKALSNAQAAQNFARLQFTYFID